MTDADHTIAAIRCTDLRFSRTPDTLKKNLCTPTSRFKNDALSRDVQWFGSVALTLVEVETAGGLTGLGTVGGCLAPTDRPGLGIEVNCAAVEDLRHG